MRQSKFSRILWWQEHRNLKWIILLGLIHGLLYTFIVPPWQHYDEPTHFEYAWLIANTGELPQLGDHNLLMRREVAASMVEHDFFVNQETVPNFISEKPTWIGITQLGDPPAHYFVSALFMRFFKFFDVESQLYAGRLVSLLFYITTIALAYIFACELFHKRSPLRWALPAAIALTPAFTDLMTAINNDVGATVSFSLFLLLGIRIMLRGFTPGRMVGLLVIAGICVFTKNTVYVAVPLVFILFLLPLYYKPMQRRWLPALLLIIAIGGGAQAMFEYKDAAFWYRSRPYAEMLYPTRSYSSLAPNGTSVLEMKAPPDDERWLTLSQPLTPQAIQQIQGKLITLGMWIWASEATEVDIATLFVDGKATILGGKISESPTFFSITHLIPNDAKRIQVTLHPTFITETSPTAIYLDGITLATGEFPPDETPAFANTQGNKGDWGEQTFINLIQNPSMEKSWFTLASGANRFLQKIDRAFPKYAIYSLQDFKTFGYAYQLTAINLFQSFWARFGWNHIGLPDVWYGFIALFTAAGLAGAFWRIRIGWKTYSAKQKATLLWLSFALAAVWGNAFIRTTLPVFGGSLFIPSARYAYPAIIPTMLVLTAGWHNIIRFSTNTKRWAATLFLFFLTLAALSLTTIVQYYS